MQARQAIGCAKGVSISEPAAASRQLGWSIVARFCA